ncbi:MAG: sugar phosphate isomerase/epimerase family protein [Candidatus Hydrogenedentota bacterium]
MKLGLFLAMFGDKSFNEVLETIRPLGLQTVEFGMGNYPGAPHLNVKELLESKPKRDELLATLKGEGLEISALSAHGNCLHPDEAFAKANQEVQTDAIKLASLLGIKTVNDFAGCPGSDENAKRPCWVTCPWPPDYLETLDWQWNERVIPYWTRQAKFAADHGVNIGFEMHPGFVVYNTETLLRIRRECGKSLGANFDPSHLWWQGMDPIKCIREIGGDAMFHVHAKDALVYNVNSDINGVLDTKHYGEELRRSWLFRSVGYGHGLEWWNDFASTLRMVGYDGPVSIEHEDSLMTPMEGLTKAIELLKNSLIFQEKGAITWA